MKKEGSRGEESRQGGGNNVIEELVPEPGSAGASVCM